MLYRCKKCGGIIELKRIGLNKIMFECEYCNIVSTIINIDECPKIFFDFENNIFTLDIPKLEIVCDENE